MYGCETSISIIAFYVICIRRVEKKFDDSRGNKKGQSQTYVGNVPSHKICDWPFFK